MPNPSHLPWTPDELEALRLAYSHWPVRWDLLHERSSQRTRGAILGQAYKRNLTGRTLAKPDYSKVAKVQWAYLAGAIDADGTIAVKQGGCRVGVILCNTHRPLIDWAATTFPGGGSHTVTVEKTNAHRSRAGYAPGKKDMHRATWQRLGAVVPLLRGIIPHMIVKRERAEEALAVALADTA